jgi:hypothetical protein
VRGLSRKDILHLCRPGLDCRYPPAAAGAGPRRRRHRRRHRRRRRRRGHRREGRALAGVWRSSSSSQSAARCLYDMGAKNTGSAVRLGPQMVGLARLAPHAPCRTLDLGPWQYHQRPASGLYALYRLGPELCVGCGLRLLLLWVVGCGTCWLRSVSGM